MRPSKDEWGLQLAEVVARRSTCARRSVGCILTDGRGRVLATGYNGVAAGLPHCNEVIQQDQPYLLDGVQIRKGDAPYRCPGADLPTGQGLDACQAIHAEANALLQCRDPDAVHTCYTTVSPCVGCVKLLLGSGCLRVVFREPYAHDEAARALWERGPFLKEWVRLTAPKFDVAVTYNQSRPHGFSAAVLCGYCGEEVPVNHECRGR